MTTPSPLDAPRFVDDPTLSEWSITGDTETKRVAPLAHFAGEVQPIVHNHHKRWPRKIETDPGPINIEFIRGALGTDGNTWQMTVDGVRCEPRPLKDDELVDRVNKDDPTPTCTLAAPFDDGKNATIWNENRVRPVMISARLEDEALSPQKIEVVIQQVVFSTERNVSNLEGESEVIELDRIAVEPYTLQTATGTVITLPYPFSAPSQSALIISASKQLEIENINKHNKDVDKSNTELKDKIYTLKADGAKLKKDLEAKEKDAAEIESEISTLKEEIATQQNIIADAQRTPTAATKDVVDEARGKIKERQDKIDSKTSKLETNQKKIKTQEESIKKKATNLKTEEDKKPKEKKALPVITLPSGKEALDRNYYIIGSEKNSAPHSLSKDDGIIDRLIKTCRETNPKDELLTNVMNNRLGAGDKVAAAFVQTLNTGTSILFKDEEAAKKNLHLAKVLRDDTAPKTDNDMTKYAKDFDNLQTQVAKALANAQVDDKTCQFVYDLLPHTRRKNTSTRLRYIVEITDHDYVDSDSRLVKFALEPLRDHAHAAYAIYAKLPTDLNKLNAKLSELQAEIMKQPSREQRKNAYSLLEELKIAMHSTLPNWPPVLDIDKVNDIDKSHAEPADTPNNKMEVLRRLPQCVIATEKPLKAFKTPVNTTIANPAHPEDEATKSSLATKILKAYLKLLFASVVGSAILATAATTIGFIIALTAATATYSYIETVKNLVTGRWFGAVKSVIGILSSPFKGAYVTIYYQGYAARKGIKLGAIMADAVVNTATGRYGENSNDNREKRWYFHFQAVKYATERLNPIVSSVAVAKHTQARLHNLGALAKTTRMHFIEYYNAEKLPSAFTSNMIRPPYTKDAWYSVPNATSMILLPPADIVDALYEATALRRVPMGAVVKRVVGAVAKVRDSHGQNLTATTPAELSARTAHIELMNITRGVRSAFLSGENLMNSAGQVTLELTENGASLINQLYKSESIARLISGDDLIWSCLPGGVAVRLALRHMPLFTRAQQLTENNQTGWNSTHCALMRAFGDAWVSEARSAARSEAKIPHPIPDRQMLSIDATRSFARVQSLMDQNENIDPTATYVVASSYAPLLLAQNFHRSMKNKTWNPAPGVQTAIETERTKAAKFLDQNAMRTSTMLRKASRHIAAWASRRLDAFPMREWRPTSGVDKLIETLADVEIQNGINDEDHQPVIARHYYCPIGGRIESLPGHVPFAIEALGTRLVWTTDLLREARRLQIHDASTLTNKPTDNASTITANIVQPLGKGLGGMRGLERHPLTVSARDANDVSILLSDMTKVRNDDKTNTSNAQTLLETLQTMATGAVGKRVEARIASMRSVAFNADRFLNALDLVEAGPAAQQMDIILPGPGAVLPLALALAMHSKDANADSKRIDIYAYLAANDEASANEILNRVIAASEHAMEVGCKAVTLAEACAVLS